ncbi:YetF domain-containing protein [Virgibacillus necropolis]|uniref:DUF421 domain-containing protein n=1 Tax=Virgibacillus necropolis TaxID=163877 RepID=A0A221MFK3_9BACI|nr:DUF421 domain-containing protein [Virgibacillus necropolis]ASN06453.1 hypothetical protein CFK40_16230 [Virgibacillus necropolis]
MPLSELALRLAIAFLTLLLLTRIMGRKEISQMTFFNFISGIAIGTIGASLAIDSTISIRNGFLALIGWSAFTIVLGLLDIKSKKIRLLVEGQPIILIKQGKIMESSLRKARLDINALNALLRQKNVFSVTDVDYAIFETSGKLSVMKMEAKQLVTKSEMNIPQVTTNVFPIATSIISDGKIDKGNMEKLNLTKQWLDQQLQLARINSITDVFYAEVQKDGTLYIDKRNDSLS